MVPAVYEREFQNYEIGTLIEHEKNRRLVVGIFNIPEDIFSEPYLVNVAENGAQNYLNFMRGFQFPLEGRFAPNARNFVENFSSLSHDLDIRVTSMHNRFNMYPPIGRVNIDGGISGLLDTAKQEYPLGAAFPHTESKYKVNGRILGMNNSGSTVFLTMHDSDYHGGPEHPRHKLIDLSAVVPSAPAPSPALQRGGKLVASLA